MADPRNQDSPTSQEPDRGTGPTRGPDAGTSTADKGPTRGTAGTAHKPKVQSRRVTPPKAAADRSTRYTAKGTNAQHRGPSPQWVPIVMFALWGLGLLIIILNYMTVLPGATATASGWYLIAGLLALLAGIVVATQYR